MEKIQKTLDQIAWDDEEFKVIPGLESYAINRDGVVKALPKIREGVLSCLNNMAGRTDKSQRHYKERIIRPHFRARYWYVSLMHNGIKKGYRVHRLVYRTFVGPIPDDMVIDHIDGDRNNNNIANLRYVTPSENMQNPNTKYNVSVPILQLDPVTYKIVGRFRSMTDALISLGKEYKPEMSGHIGECCKGKRRTTLGYCWQYESDWKSGENHIRPDCTKCIIQYDLNNNYLAKYDSVAEAAAATGCDATSIIDNAKGRIKKPKKFIWKYNEH